MLWDEPCWKNAGSRNEARAVFQANKTSTVLSIVYVVEQWRRVVTNELTVFDALPTVGLWPPCELRADYISC